MYFLMQNISMKMALKKPKHLNLTLNNVIKVTLEIKNTYLIIPQ